MDALIEFGKLLIPASVVLYAVYLLVKSFTQKEIDLKNLEVRGSNLATILPIRLQAYERMTLFLERVAPHNMLIRLNTASIPSREFHQLLLAEIRNEYNHNVAQQVYIGEDVWNLIKGAKEDLILTINEAAAEMPQEASSLDLSKKIFEKTINKSIDPIGHAISELKKEIQRTF
ncbi:MAG TPA: hypothetical protein VD927_12860 [Chryseosolibacter sp.]|nr:hypothetical protein [Chryseosolibacter sp.]